MTPSTDTVTAGPEVLDVVRSAMPERPARWLVTGAAGFIGSHLVECLLAAGQEVVGFDNFATGRRETLDAAVRAVGPDAARRFTFLEGDIRDEAACARACQGAAYVLHQAALGSVPRSIKDPATSHHVNVTGFVNMALAARDAGVRRFVYASSSSVYGDHPALPKKEAETGNVLSPYAATKKSNELFGEVFARVYGVPVTGLRYFNVFGPRQDPAGPYAAVIPKWMAAIRRGEPCVLNGDGETSRDFCYIANAVAANVLAATAPGERAVAEVFNIACGDRTTLLDLYGALRDGARDAGRTVPDTPVLADFRAGDIRHSLADVSRARDTIGYRVLVRAPEGLKRTVTWYLGQSA
ncbi:MAG: NAD-dependent epimerase/dehydratase family protein [Gemmatimonadota bacterium]|jgi:UDP-N-acetylglucosamine 4-epimerase